MANDKINSWGQAQADSYIKIADFVVIERRRVLKIFTDIFKHHFDNKEKLVLLDLGCGHGVLSKHIASNYPKNEFHLIDGSTVMLEKAKQNMSAANVRYDHLSFDEYIASPPNDRRYDFVYSANAIHHLDLQGKSEIYAKIFRELKVNGLFLNFDPVLPSSAHSEELQFNMWKEWMVQHLQENRTQFLNFNPLPPSPEDSKQTHFSKWRDWMRACLQKNGIAEVRGKIDGIPADYKMKPENKPSNLVEQLQLLTKIGYKDVDCFYKYSIFALFGGTRQKS